jgi:WD40 repeat protein
VFSAAFSADGARVVTASHDNTARLWDAATGQLLGVPFEQGYLVDSAAFSADGTQVVTTAADKTARVWDARTGSGWARRSYNNRSATFSADGAAVTASDDGALAAGLAAGQAPPTL